MTILQGVGTVVQLGGLLSRLCKINLRPEFFVSWIDSNYLHNIDLCSGTVKCEILASQQCARSHFLA